jgi:hypothetical protein
VQVRLNPAHDASGHVDIWLNGTFCGAYQGPMADRDLWRPRNGSPFINARLRFGMYRDWRAETQTIYFDKIMFWKRGPGGTPQSGRQRRPSEIAKDRSHVTTLRDPLPAECSGRL